jgi:hypothetical protein
LFIVGFKSAATERINALRGTPSAPVWQRNYYEHIIRDEKSLNRIRQYIAENPLRWHLDAENPNRIGDDPLWHNLFTQRPMPMCRALPCDPTILLLVCYHDDLKRVRSQLRNS